MLNPVSRLNVNNAPARHQAAKPGQPEGAEERQIPRHQQSNVLD